VYNAVFLIACLKDNVFRTVQYIIMIVKIVIFHKTNFKFVVFRKIELKFSIKKLYAKIRKTIVKAANSSAINVNIPVYSAL
jgi:hypothetical protein